jgi:hypothetical protein
MILRQNAARKAGPAVLAEAGGSGTMGILPDGTFGHGRSAEPSRTEQ